MALRRKFFFTAALITLGAVVVCGLALILLKERLIASRITPRADIADYQRPPAPEYAVSGAWALWPRESAEAPVDIFHVHSTVTIRRDNWNGDIGEPAAEGALRRAIERQAAPFEALGQVYSPRYRQATRAARMTFDRNGRAAHAIAYGDIEAAFDVFLANRADPARLLVMAGFGQGGAHALGLLVNRVSADPEIQSSLAAAYIIDAPAPLALFEDGALALSPCATPEQAGCLIAFQTVLETNKARQKKLRREALVIGPDARASVILEPDLLCSAPPLWSVPDETSSRPACEDGLLLVDADTLDGEHRQGLLEFEPAPEARALFTDALVRDARQRVMSLVAARNRAEPTLAPIDEAIDLEDSPVNKVRD